MDINIALNDLRAAVTTEFITLNNKINDVASSIKQLEVELASLVAATSALKMPTMKAIDKYKSFPNEADLDAEEAKELNHAKEAATDEWKALKSAEMRNSYIMSKLNKENKN